MDWTTVKRSKKKDKKDKKETEFCSFIKVCSTLSELAKKINLQKLDTRSFRHDSLESQVLLFLKNPCGSNYKSFPSSNKIRDKIKEKFSKEEKLILDNSKIYISLCLYHIHNGCSNDRNINISLNIDNKDVDVSACYQKIIPKGYITFRLHLDFSYVVKNDKVIFSLYEPGNELDNVPEIDWSKFENVKPKKKSIKKDAFEVSLLSKQPSLCVPKPTTSYISKAKKSFIPRIKKEIKCEEVVSKPILVEEPVSEVEEPVLVVEEPVLEVEEPVSVFSPWKDGREITIPQKFLDEKTRRNIVFGDSKTEERKKALDELIETIDISKTTGDSIVEDIENDIARCGEELREQIMTSRIEEMSEIIIQKDTFIRHLIQKIDDLKMYNLTMNSSILQLEEEIFRLDKIISQLQGYEESICSLESFDTKSIVVEDYSELDINN